VQIKPYSSTLGFTAPLGNMRRDMAELQRQVGTGRLSETYGGLGAGRSVALAMRAELGRIEGHRSTIQTVGTRISIATKTLQRLSALQTETKSDALARQLDLAGGSASVAQKNASQRLQETVSLLNTDVNGRHLFSGRATDRRPVASATSLIEGEAGKAGFRQIAAERLAADGADATGTLRTTAAGSTASVARLGSAGFGLTVLPTSVRAPATVTTAAVAGPPPSTDFNFASAPNEGDRIAFDLELPDGTTRQIALTASASPTSDAQFKTGANSPARAQSATAGLTSATTLAAAGLANGQTLTVSDGSTTYSYTVTNALTETVSTIMGGLAGSAVAAEATIEAGRLVISGANSATTISIAGSAGLALGYGLAPNAPRPVPAVATSALSGLADATPLASAGFAVGDTFTVGDGTSTFTHTVAAGDTLGTLRTALDAHAVNATSSIDASGRLVITADNPNQSLTIGGSNPALGYEPGPYKSGLTLSAEGFAQALEREIGKLAKGELAAASAFIAADGLFPADGAAPKRTIPATATSAAAGLTDATTLAAAGFSDGDSFTLSDGVNPVFTFSIPAAPGSAAALTIGDLRTALNAHAVEATATLDAAGRLVIEADNTGRQLTLGGNIAALGYPANAGPTFAAADPATTVAWYEGETGAGARGSATALVDEGTTVSYGAQASETPLAGLVATLAVVGTLDFASGAKADNERRYTAMMDRAQTRTAEGGKPQTIANITAEIAVADQALERAKSRLAEKHALASELVTDVEGVDKEEATLMLLDLQTRLQASYEVTSMLSRLSLVQFL